MIVASRVAHTLAAAGITRAYGLPGEDHLTLLDAFAEAGIEYYTAYNESSAVIMAATDALLSDTPGVVLLSLAPGISNGMNGLVHAYMEGLPVIVISGNHPAARGPLVVRQGFDLDQLMDPVTKWSGKIAPGTDASVAVCKALDIATAGRPGPVYLEVPDEVAVTEEKTSSDVVEVLREQWDDRGSSRLPGNPPTNRSLQRLQARLSQAQRPALVIGGRRYDVSHSTVSAFTEAFGCPVFTSSGQKGLATDDDPYFAGTFLNGSLETKILDRSDLIILVNPEAYDIYNRPWSYDATTVAITPTPFDEWIYPFDDRIVADPDATLLALVKASDQASPAWTVEEITEYRQAVRDALLGDSDLTVTRTADAALASAPKNVRIIADAGFGKPPVAMLSRPEKRGCYLASNALSTMGFAIPAALASTRCSDRPVLTFVGDGSLLMRATELMAARGSSVPLIVVALMDESLTQIEIKQERRDLTEVGVQLPAVSCEDLAKGLGIDGVDVHTVEELSDAMATGWRNGRTLLIGAHVQTAASRTVFEVLRG